MPAGRLRCKALIHLTEQEWRAKLLATIHPRLIPKIASMVFWDFLGYSQAQKNRAPGLYDLWRGYRVETDDVTEDEILTCLVALGYPERVAKERAAPRPDRELVLARARRYKLAKTERERTANDE